MLLYLKYFALFVLSLHHRWSDRDQEDTGIGRDWKGRGAGVQGFQAFAFLRVLRFHSGTEKSSQRNGLTELNGCDMTNLFFKAHSCFCIESSKGLKAGRSSAPQ